MSKNKLFLDRKELAKVLRKKQKQGKKVVTTNGCFDLLHVGHLRYLQEAKKLGDILVIGVNSDESVKQIKSDKRPLIPEEERAEMLAGMECVDYVTIFPELDPIPLIHELKPDVHVKGGDYTLEELPERKAVESYGGRCVVGINIPGRSTTDIIHSIVERF